MFYGWRGAAERESTATKWLTLLYVPIFPLARYRLTPATRFEREKFANSPKEVAAALVGYGSRTDTYRISAKLSLNLAEVLATYAKAYIALPILIAWPWLLLYSVRLLFGTHPEWEDKAWFIPAVVAFAAASLVNAVVVPMWAIQSARGYRGGQRGLEGARRNGR